MRHLAESPREQILALRVAVATDRSLGDTAALLEFCLSSLSSSSWIARLGTEFLLSFLACPISNFMRLEISSSSLIRDLKAGAGSVRIVAGNPSKGQSSTQSCMIVSRSVVYCLF